MTRFDDSPRRGNGACEPLRRVCAPDDTTHIGRATIFTRVSTALNVKHRARRGDGAAGRPRCFETQRSTVRMISESIFVGPSLSRTRAGEKKNRALGSRLSVNKSMDRDQRHNHLFTPVRTGLADASGGGPRVSKEVHCGVPGEHAHVHAVSHSSHLIWRARV